MNTIGSDLEVDDILLAVKPANKRQLFEVIGRHMQDVHGVPAESVAATLERREMAASTALGHGVAIPHARLRELDRIRIVYARLMPALAFDTPDRQAVSDIVALMVPAPAAQDHLDVLAQVAARFADRDFRQALQECHEPLQVKRLFERWRGP